MSDLAVLDVINSSPGVPPPAATSDYNPPPSERTSPATVAAQALASKREQFEFVSPQ